MVFRVDKLKHRYVVIGDCGHALYSYARIVDIPKSMHDLLLNRGDVPSNVANFASLADAQRIVVALAILHPTRQNWQIR
jgi:hypothetical protein